MTLSQKSALKTVILHNLAEKQFVRQTFDRLNELSKQQQLSVNKYLFTVCWPIVYQPNVYQPFVYRPSVYWPIVYRPIVYWPIVYWPNDFQMNDTEPIQRSSLSE